MEQVVFEVLLHFRPEPSGGKARWYIVSAHTRLLDAEAAYDDLAAELPKAAPLSLVIVRSEHDKKSGLFRDRIVKAIGQPPMISRTAIKPLDAATKQELMGLGAQKPSAEMPAAGGRAAAPARQSALSGPWIWLGFLAVTIGLFLAIAIT